MTAARRGMAKNHCCWTRDGENPLLLDAGRRNPTAARRRTERNQHCWPRDGEKLLLLDAGLREITAADFQTKRYYCCLLDEIWREPTAVGLLLDVDRREITAAGRGEIARPAARCRSERNHCCWTRGYCETSLRAVGHGTARNCCCWTRDSKK